MKKVLFLVLSTTLSMISTWPCHGYVHNQTIELVQNKLSCSQLVAVWKFSKAMPRFTQFLLNGTPLSDADIKLFNEMLKCKVHEALLPHTKEIFESLIQRQ